MVTIITPRNMFDRCAPSAEAVIAAVRRAEEEAGLYAVARDGSGWTVTRKGQKGRSYLQTENPFAPDPAFPISCTCPAHERNGFCKHVAMVEQYEAIDAAEAEYMEREFARYEAEYAGRY